MADNAAMLFSMNLLRDQLKNATDGLAAVGELERREAQASQWRKGVDDRLKSLAESLDGLVKRQAVQEDELRVEREEFRAALDRADRVMDAAPSLPAVPTVVPGAPPPPVVPRVSVQEAFNDATVRMLKHKLAPYALALAGTFFVGVWTLIAAAWLDVPAHKVRAFLPGGDPVAEDDDDHDDADGGHPPRRNDSDADAIAFPK